MLQTTKHPLHVQHDHADPVLARADRSFPDGPQLLVLHDGPCLQVRAVLPHYFNDRLERQNDTLDCMISRPGGLDRLRRVSVCGCDEAGATIGTLVHTAVIRHKHTGLIRMTLR